MPQQLDQTYNRQLRRDKISFNFQMIDLHLIEMVAPIEYLDFSIRIELRLFEPMARESLTR